jgi:hypothetical protein
MTMAAMRPGVLADDVATGDRQRYQRLEGGPQQALRVDVRGDGADGKAGRQQEDDSGDPQAAGENLRSDGERDDEAHSEQDLIGRHGSFPFSAVESFIRSVSFRSRRRRPNMRDSRHGLRSTFSTQDRS